MTLNDLQDKKILVVGAGVNNRNLAEYLQNQGFFFESAEWQNLAELTERLKQFDVVFRTPGLPYLSHPVQEAIQAGVIVSSQTKLFFDLCPCPIVGVTGTKGKGTVASLLAQILQAHGKNKVWLGGNSVS